MSFGIDSAIAAGLSILDKFIPDPAAKAKAAAELRDSLQKWDTGQMEVNKQEAASSSVFVAGWRPAIGWVCAGALFYQYLLAPVLTWATAAVGFYLPTPPSLDGSLWELMFGLLGMGGLRTYEKIAGVARK